jgi:hypothetical protein
VAVQASREVIFDAAPEAIVDVLADIDAVPSWSALHKNAEVLDRHPDGRPHHVKATLKIMGITDKEILEYHWGDRWMGGTRRRRSNSAANTASTTSPRRVRTRRGCGSTSSWTCSRPCPRF